MTIFAIAFLIILSVGMFRIVMRQRDAIRKLENDKVALEVDARANERNLDRLFRYNSDVVEKKLQLNRELGAAYANLEMALKASAEPPFDGVFTEIGRDGVKYIFSRNGVKVDDSDQIHIINTTNKELYS